MLEQEIASAIRYILEATGNPAAIYKIMPQDFFIPAAYFPQPFIGSGGDTFATYSLKYRWYIKFFHVDSPESHRMALVAANAIRAGRGLIPLILESGEPSGGYMRIDEVNVQTIDNGITELALEWTSRRPYIRDSATLIKEVDVNIYAKGAYERAIGRISADSAKQEEIYEQ